MQLTYLFFNLIQRVWRVLCYQRKYVARYACMCEAHCSLYRTRFSS